jgi:hypothetical protein
MVVFGFRTVPVEVAVSSVLAWAELDWPVTREQAFAVRDKLGWTGSPEDYRLFTTNFGLGTEDGSLSADGHLDLVNFTLSTLAPQRTSAEVAERSWAAFDAYLTAFSALFGKPKRQQHREVTSAEWTLPNGASVYLGGMDQMIQVEVESPELREAEEVADEGA